VIRQRHSNKKASKGIRHVKPSRRFLLAGLARWESLIVLLALLCDLNSWGHTFAMDDYPYIVDNLLVKAPLYIFKIFALPFGSTPILIGRPFTLLTLAANYRISGPHPDGFHLINRLLHVLICLVIYWTVRRLIPQPRYAALVTSLLFAVHPLQTEAVTYITGRSDALAMLLGLSALLLFVKFRRSARPSIKHYIASLVLYFLALLSKENAITWFGVLLLVEFIYFSECSLKQFIQGLRKNLMKTYAGFIGVTFLFLLLYFGLLYPLMVMPTRFVENPLAHTSNLVRILTALKVLFQSLGLLFWPSHLSSDYSYNQIPLITHWNSSAGLSVLILSLIPITLLVWSYRNSKDFFFGLSYFLITYSVVSNLLFPIGTIRADRLLYMPSLGIFLCVGLALARLDEIVNLPSRRLFFRAALAGILLLLAIRTIARNGDWRDQFTLYSQSARTAPGSAKAHAFLGWEYVQKGQRDLAIKEFEIAGSIYPEFPDLYFNWGSLMLQEGKAAEAVTYFRKSIALGFNQAGTLNDLGVALRAQGDLAGAIAQFDEVIRKYPDDAIAHFNKAEALSAQGNINEAIREYSRTLELDPEYLPARTSIDLLMHQTSSPSPPNK
jgi:tetratricopeptide (TPR) repeat protein